MKEEPNLLGEYLRARRELVTPEQAGIPVRGPRRVLGLRREEVAMLSGISADYYLRLEQAEAAMFPQWKQTTAGLVSSFRNSIGTDTDDPRVIELVGELSVASPHFRQL